MEENNYPCKLAAWWCTWILFWIYCRISRRP